MVIHAVLVVLSVLLLHTSGQGAQETPSSPKIPAGVCNNKNLKKYPDMGKCKRYLKCDDGSSISKGCANGTNFNWLHKRCDNATECNDGKKVSLKIWVDPFSSKGELIENGTSGGHSGLKTIKRETLSMKKVPIPNTKMPHYVRISTYYFAITDGWHNFTGECWILCRVWLRKINGCHQKKLVLEVKGNKTIIQNPVSLEFAQFYNLIVVYVSNKSTYDFKIGVNYETKHDGKNWIWQPIHPELLRMNVEENCSSTPETTTTATTTTATPTTKKTVATTTTTTTTKQMKSSTTQKTTKNTPTRTTEYKSTTRSTVPTSSMDTRTWQPPTTERNITIETLETSVKVLADNLSDYLSTSKVFHNKSITSGQRKTDGFVHVINVDKKGEAIARKWTRKGQSLNISHGNVVMEVSFPVTNYTFPLAGFANTDSKDDRGDQIFIPASALVNTSGEFDRRIFSALYLNMNKRLPKFFKNVETEMNKEINGVFELNSKVIASTAVPSIHGLKDHDIIIKLVHLKSNFSADTKLLCAFYKWSETDRSNGVWSTEGCFRDEPMSSQNISICRCNHLTHFGILMQINDIEMNPSDVQALRLISYIGCALSLTGAALTILAIVILPGARSDRNFIHANLATAIALAQITFLAGIDETSNKTICTVVAALLHYFLLAAFSWMLIEGIFLHILIVKVFHDQLPKKRYYITFCWGLPAIIVLLSVNLLRDGYGTETSCWLSSDKLTIWTFMGPAIIVMTINIIILCKVMKEISTLRTSGRREITIRTVRNGFRSAVILLPLLGITWALGLICVNGSPIAFQYLFAIFNSLQGLFIFLFHCLFNTEVRKAFWRKVDLWCTTHHIGSNGHSPSCSKKSKDDNSFSCPTNKGQNRSTSHDQNPSGNRVQDEVGRKISCDTNSSYIESWPPKSPIDSCSSFKRYPGRFSPILADITDIRYHLDQVDSQKDETGELKKISSTPSLSMAEKHEQTNGNTKSLDNIHSIPNGRKNNGENVAQNGVSHDQSAVCVGIGNQPLKSVRKIVENLNQRNIRLVDVNRRAAVQPSKNIKRSPLNSQIAPAQTINNKFETKL